MKRKNIIINFVLIAFVLASISGCNLSKLKSGEMNGEQQSLILLSNNFIKNSFQVRLVDVETLNSISNDETVLVSSNKKVIDMEGHYTNKFGANNGVVNFAIDPNETISATDTLKLIITSKDNTKEYLPSSSSFAVTKPGKKVFLMPQAKLSSATVTNIATNQLEGIKSNSANSIKANAGLSSNFQLYTYNLSYSKDAQGNTVTTKTPVTIFGKQYNRPYWGSDYYFFDYSETGFQNNDVLIGIIPNKDYTYITSMTFLNDQNSSYFVDYYFGSNFRGVGLTSVFAINPYYYHDYYGNLSTFYTTGHIIPKTSSNLDFIRVEAALKYDVVNCSSGLNFNFTGIPLGAFPNFLYTHSDADNNVRSGGIANPLKSDSVFNTGEMNFKVGDNFIDFYSTQFDITPSHAKFTSSECNKTFNFTVKPKQGLVKIKFMLKLNCEGSASSLSPNLNLDLIKDNYLNVPEPFSTENGVSVLYIAQDAKYKIMGTYGGKKIDFNFSLDANVITKLINETLAANAELKDIKVSVVPGAQEIVVTITPVYKSGSCPF